MYRKDRKQMKNHVFCRYHKGKTNVKVRGLNDKDSSIIHVLYNVSEKKPKVGNIAGFKDCKLHSLPESLEEIEQRLKQILQEDIESGDSTYFIWNDRPDPAELVFMQILLGWRGGEVYLINGEELVPAFSAEEDKIQDVYSRLHDLICSRNYHSAGKMVYHSVQNPDLTKLLLFGERLKNLDVHVRDGQEDYFDLLIDTLKEMEEDEEVIQYALSMKGLRNKDQKAFISYLHNSAERLYEENKLIDFVVLLYRLAEELLLFALGWDIDWDAKGSESFMNRKNAYFKLELPGKERVTRHFHSYLNTLEKHVKKFKNKKDLTEADKYFQEVYKLFSSDDIIEILKLRHAGVSGHGFCDFSKEQFNSICQTDPLEKMNPIVDFLNIRTETGLFELLEKSCLYLARKGLEARVASEAV
ncbi:hypothetical protein [Peribacillus kribbensis]|uniref:hypothetical protein n=1 Tax=Peribacillus kribbensis TaxID=356658 RepID=UPI00047E85DB|nr:hypothetical protein [Peribacillus kribbensis]